MSIPFFLLILACFEICRGMMVVSTIDEAVRAGCRVAVLRGSTVTDVQTEVASFLGIASIGTHSVAVQPSNLDATEEWDPVTVTVSAAFSDMSWIPLPKFLGGKTYSASCTLPREGGSS